MVTGTVVVVVEIGAGETAGSAAGSIAVGVSGVTVIVTGTVIGMVVVVPVVVMASRYSAVAGGSSGSAVVAEKLPLLTVATHNMHAGL